MTAHSSSPLVEVKNLHVCFNGQRKVHAVNGVDLRVNAGEVVTLLGESGCGKSVTLRSLMRLLPIARTTFQGSVHIDGHDMLSLPEAKLARLRGPVVSMAFQEPSLAMDPIYTIGEQIAESVIAHEGIDHRAAMRRALDMLEHVKIPSAQTRLKAYPHELSGGMRQRAMIALALACKPKLLLADEPTTALDATVQIQVLLLLRELQAEMGMSIIFVTHDIGVAAQISDRIAVMYAGKIIEEGDVHDIVRTPTHPYTRGLLGSLVHEAPQGRPLSTIRGAPPLLDRIPTSCSFAPRCNAQSTACQALPSLVSVTQHHQVRCFHPVLTGSGVVNQASFL